MRPRGGLTEDSGHEIARHEKCRMKIDYITVQYIFCFKTT